MISDGWIQTDSYIDGRWVGADSAETISVTNPATGVELAKVPRCGRAETARAIAAASRAFPAWRGLLAKERAELMFAIHDALLAEK